MLSKLLNAVLYDVPSQFFVSHNHLVVPLGVYLYYHCVCMNPKRRGRKGEKQDFNRNGLLSSLLLASVHDVKSHKKKERQGMRI